MLNNVGPKERLAYIALVAGALLFMGIIGSQYLRRPADIVFQSPPGSASPGANGPSSPPPATPAVTPGANLAVVHVVGAVKQPGVVRLTGDARVQDAIAKAGGAKPNADLIQVNLAAKLVDGTQLYVPSTSAGLTAPVAEVYRGGPTVAGPYSPAPAKSSRRSSGGKPEPASRSVALNSASGDQLQALPGVGPATAEKILEYRKAHGGFSSIDELMAVKGIGPKKLAKMRKYLRL